MDQAPVLDVLCFDLPLFFQDRRASHEVVVGRLQGADAFLVSARDGMLDQGGDGILNFATKAVVFQKDAVLERPMSKLDLALSLGVSGRTRHVIHPVFLEVFGEIPRDVTETVIAE